MDEELHPTPAPDDDCPCGSGQRYADCCGRETEAENTPE